MRKINHLFAAVSLAVGLFFITALAFAGGKEDSYSTVHKMVDPVTGASCSAVMLAPERALTAQHCTNMVSPVLQINGVSYPVMEAYVNPNVDLAILIVPNAPCPCVVIGERANEGDKVYQLGYPWGDVLTIGEGEVLGRGILWDTLEVVATSAWGAPGMSGGGVFNEKGELVGILIAGDLETGIPTFYVEVILVRIK